MVNVNDSISINYLGDKELITHPLYSKWSQYTISQNATDIASLKDDLKNITCNMDNLAIISYLSTILRAIALSG